METRVQGWSSIVMAKPTSSLRFGPVSRDANFTGPTVRRRLHAKKGEPKLHWHSNRLLSNRNSIVLTPRVSVLKLAEKLQTAENDNSHNNGKPDRMTSASHLASTLRAVSPFGRCEFVASGAGEAYDARRQRSRAQSGSWRYVSGMASCY
jgi:hypothetical protein